MKKVVIIILALVILISTFLAAALITYKTNTSAVSKDSIEVEVEIMENHTFSTLGSLLYNKGLIKSEFFYKIFVKLNNPENLQKGIYKLNKNMSLDEIIDTLENGSNYNPDLIFITFKEGWNIRKIASKIAELTSNTYEDVISVMNNKEYMNEIIANYWFIDESILDSRIYYPLEGYLFPETYQITKKNTTKEIIKIMLDHTAKILNEYKEDIENSKYSVHQMLTLASIVELEAGNSDDRAGVSGVFYNRLNAKWSLGSDVTTYYASKIDDWSYSLTYKELNDCNNAYNTRCKTLIGLPVGPISNPGRESIVASINPSNHDYYYFVADCKGKTYLNKDSAGHSTTINKLKSEGNWCA